MDIVSGGITVDDFKRLSSHHSQDMWMVLAAALIDGYGRRGNVKRAISQTFLHVHENVGQLVGVRYHSLGRVRTLAGRILAHVNFRRLGGATVQTDCAADTVRARRIDRCRCARIALSGRLFLAWFIAVCSKRTKAY